MKATKALRRIEHIQALMSDVMERYSTRAPSIRKALQDATTAIARAKAAVSKGASSETTTNTQVKQSKQTAKSMPVLPEAKRKLSAGTPAKTYASKKAATKQTRPAKATETRALAAMAAVKKAAQKTTPAQVETKILPG